MLYCYTIYYILRSMITSHRLTCSNIVHVREDWSWLILMFIYRQTKHRSVDFVDQSCVSLVPSSIFFFFGTIHLRYMCDKYLFKYLLRDQERIAISTLKPANYVRAVLAAKTQCNAMHCTAQYRPGPTGAHGAQRIYFNKTQWLRHNSCLHSWALVDVGQDGAMSVTKGMVSFFQIKYVKKALSLSLMLLLVAVCFNKYV